MRVDNDDMIGLCNIACFGNMTHVYLVWLNDDCYVITATHEYIIMMIAICNIVDMPI